MYTSSYMYMCYVNVGCECMDVLYPELLRQLSLLSYNHPYTHIFLQTCVIPYILLKSPPIYTKSHVCI